MTLSTLIKELGIAAVPHGFKSSFRDWAAEQTNTPREVVEAALAHTVRNPTEAAYARSDLFERRRRLMNDGPLPSRRGNSFYSNILHLNLQSFPLIVSLVRNQMSEGVEDPLWTA